MTDDFQKATLSEGANIVPVSDSGKVVLIPEILPSSFLDPRVASLAERTMTAIIERPEHADQLLYAFKAIVTETERRTKNLGVMIGGGLAGMALCGAIGLAAIGGPLVAIVGLLSIAPACAGAAIFLASGERVTINDFKGMLAVRSESPSSQGDEP